MRINAGRERNQVTKFPDRGTKAPAELAQPGGGTRAVEIWLVAVSALIVTIVAIGGITRLTGSGLSIVEWAPILGAIPPMNEAEWNQVFSAYQAFPQFKLVNSTMTLSEFKFIFFWEYFHRLIGRLIGIVFLIPWLWFWVRGAIPRRIRSKLLIAFALGGAQGLMGWLMVQSGLVDRPSVSHLRLAAHLSLALILLAWIQWVLLDLREPRRLTDRSGPRGAIAGLFALICLQIVYGAFVAGLKAGYFYGTFPKMGDYWIPPYAWDLAPLWRNAIENPILVQFIHRTLGWLTLSYAMFLGYRWPCRPTWVIGGWVLLQFALGVSTLVLEVPLFLAVLHQLGACGVLLSTLRALHPAGYSVRALRKTDLTAQAIPLQDRF